MRKKPKLSKHVSQLVQKNNIVAAIKELSAEQSISMDEAKQLIDDYEAQLKIQQEKQVQAIAKKQGLAPIENIEPTGAKGLSADIQNPVKNNINKNSNVKSNFSNTINTGLDQHLENIGYKKPLLPYWVQRVLIILTITVLLGLLFWQLF